MPDPAPTAPAPGAPVPGAPALGTFLRGSGHAPPPAGGGTPPPAGGTQTTFDWRSQIPEPFREDASLKNVKDIPDLVNQFVNAQRLIGREKVPVPKDDNDQAAWDAVYKVVGRPEKPDEYALPDDYPKDDVPLDETQLNEFRKVFHAAGLSRKQFAIITKRYGDMLKGQMAVKTEAINKEITANLSALKGEWGQEFDTRIALAEHALDKFGSKEFKEMIAADPSLSNNPHLLRFMASVGQMFRDPSFQPNMSTYRAGSPITSGEALSILSKFETENADVLFNPNYRGPKNRDAVLQERVRLYAIAYPSDRG